jgi:hypothetical protein
MNYLKPGLTPSPTHCIIPDMTYEKHLTAAEFTRFLAEYNEFLDAEAAEISVDTSIKTQYNHAFQYVIDHKEQP